MQYKYKYIFNCSMSVITRWFNINLNLPIIVGTLQRNTELKSIKTSVLGDSIGTMSESNGTDLTLIQKLVTMDMCKSSNKPSNYTDFWIDPISI